MNGQLNSQRSAHTHTETHTQKRWIPWSPPASLIHSLCCTFSCLTAATSLKLLFRKANYESYFYKICLIWLLLTSPSHLWSAEGASSRAQLHTHIWWPPPMKCALYFKLLMESHRAKSNYKVVCGAMRTYLSSRCYFVEPNSIQSGSFHFPEMMLRGVIELRS